jgi:protein Mpv17
MIVVGGGDWIAQKFIEKSEKISWRRVGTLGLIGLTLAGPLLHVWFGFLFRFIPGTGLLQTAKKICMDQLLFAPVFNPLFVGYIMLLEGRFHEWEGFMRNDWLMVTVNNWKLWAPANAINFTFVPGQYQVLFANFTGVIWNCYVSWKAHQGVGHVEDPKLEEHSKTQEDDVAQIQDKAE